jgi:hypothetical protein
MLLSRDSARCRLPFPFTPLTFKVHFLYYRLSLAAQDFTRSDVPRFSAVDYSVNR